MNYEKIYYQIINKAIFEENFGLRYKENGTYYEKHHIIPSSLGGSDDKKNLVLLTAREHYLCHWLLVKRNEIGSVARKKMLKAWFMMASIGDTKRPNVNMNTYAKYRNELCQVMREAQTGSKNSQYGKHWFTNIDTGESKFMKTSSDRWILGKNWFKKQKIYSIKTKKPGYTIKGYLFYKEKEKTNDIKNEQWTKQKWNEYHSSDCKSLNDFYLKGYIDISGVTFSKRLLKFIPIFKQLSCQGKTFKPNKNLINVFE